MVKQLNFDLMISEWSWRIIGVCIAWFAWVLSISQMATVSSETSQFGSENVLTQNSWIAAGFLVTDACLLAPCWWPAWWLWKIASVIIKTGSRIMIIMIIKIMIKDGEAKLRRAKSQVTVITWLGSSLAVCSSLEAPGSLGRFGTMRGYLRLPELDSQASWDVPRCSDCFLRSWLWSKHAMRP